MPALGASASPNPKLTKQSSMDTYFGSATGSPAKSPPNKGKRQEAESSTKLDSKPRNKAVQAVKRKQSTEDDELETSRTANESPMKKARQHPVGKGYAPPSTYEHLPPLPDTIIPGLICVFVGLNPGIKTAEKSQPYAHQSNLYWPLLHSSGLTPDRRLHPSEYETLPETYSLGNTNIVGRATRDGSQLSKQEMVEGAGVLDEKIRKWKPECVCLVGKSIWEAVWKHKHGRGIRKEEFKYGFQDATENMGRVGGSGQRFFKAGPSKEVGSKGGEGAWAGARVFVATSTSGLAAGMSRSEKEEIWKRLGDWVNVRREERKKVEP